MFETYLDVLLQRDELILQFVLEGYTKEDYLKITGKEIDPKMFKKYEFNVEQSKGTNSPAHRLALEQELLQLVYNQLMPFEVFLEISNNPVMIQAKQKLQEYNKKMAMQQQAMDQANPRGGAPDVDQEALADKSMLSVQGNPQAGMLTQSPVAQEMPKLPQLPQQNIM
jgi:hypothetical protein